MDRGRCRDDRRRTSISVVRRRWSGQLPGHRSRRRDLLQRSNDPIRLTRQPARPPLGDRRNRHPTASDWIYANGFISDDLDGGAIIGRDDDAGRAVVLFQPAAVSPVLSFTPNATVTIWSRGNGRRGTNPLALRLHRFGLRPLVWRHALEPRPGRRGINRCRPERRIGRRRAFRPDDGLRHLARLLLRR